MFPSPVKHNVSPNLNTLILLPFCMIVIFGVCYLTVLMYVSFFGYCRRSNTYLHSLGNFSSIYLNGLFANRYTLVYNERAAATLHVYIQFPSNKNLEGTPLCQRYGSMTFDKMKNNLIKSEKSHYRIKSNHFT